MFQYQSAYRQNGSGLHGKVFWFTVLTFILIYAAVIAFMIVSVLPAVFMDSAWGLLWMIPMFFILMLLSLFVIYPITIGVLRYFAKAYRETNFGFKEVFAVFEKGKYSKIIKLSLIIIVSYYVFSFVFGLIMQFLFTAINAPIGFLIESLSTGADINGGQIALIIFTLVLNLLLIVLSYIPFILIAIYMFLAFMVYIDQPLIPTLDKLKIAWDVMFRAGGSLLKLLFSNVVLFVIPLVVYFIVIVAGVLIAALFNSNTAGLLFMIMIFGSTLLLVVACAIVMYFMTGSIVAYYFICRDKLDRRQAEQSVSTETDAGEYSSQHGFEDENHDNRKDDHGDDGLKPLESGNR